MNELSKCWICICKQVTDEIYSVSGDILGTCQKCNKNECELKEFIRNERTRLEEFTKCKILEKYLLENALEPTK